MTAFPERPICKSKMKKICIDMVENIAGKEENAGNQHFLHFPQCFQKYSSKRLEKTRNWFCEELKRVQEVTKEGHVKSACDTTIKRSVNVPSRNKQPVLYIDVIHSDIDVKYTSYIVLSTRFKENIAKVRVSLLFLPERIVCIKYINSILYSKVHFVLQKTLFRDSCIYRNVAELYRANTTKPH